MQNFYKLTEGADVRPLLLALHRHAKSSDVWKEDTYLRGYPQGPFGDTESVILRFPSMAVPDAEREAASPPDQHENIDLPAFKLIPEARALVFGLMAAVQGERLGRCIVNKLRPGGRIFAHSDAPEHADYWDRFHVVLHSQPGVLFRCGDEQAVMRTGEIWWFDNRVEHEVVNNSADDRIHLVVDIRTSK